MNKPTTDFIEELKIKPNVLGVVLFGSWARGNNRPDSDVDLVVILQDGYKRTVEYKDGQAFEIIYTTEKSALEYWDNNKDDCAGLWGVAKVLYDKDGTVKRLQEGAEQIIKKGKKLIDEYQKGQFEFSAKDEINAVELMMEKDIATAYLVLMYTVNNLTSLFFDLRQQWTPAPKQRFAKLKEVAPDLHALFEEFYADKINLKQKVEIAKKIIPLIFK